MKRSQIRPGAKSVQRGSTFKPPVRRRRSDVEREGHRAFAHGRETASCVICGHVGCDPHHIISEQRCRRAARWLSVPEHRLAWEKRNRLWLCRGCHSGFHARSLLILRSVLQRHARKVFQFAFEIGELPWLERMYPQAEGQTS